MPNGSLPSGKKDEVSSHGLIPKMDVQQARKEKGGWGKERKRRQITNQIIMTRIIDYATQQIG